MGLFGVVVAAVVPALLPPPVPHAVLRQGLRSGHVVRPYHCPSVLERFQSVAVREPFESALMPIWRGPLGAASLGHISGPAGGTATLFDTSPVLYIVQSRPPGTRGGGGGHRRGGGRRGGGVTREDGGDELGRVGRGGVGCLQYSGSDSLMVGLNTPPGWPGSDPNSNFSK